MRKAFELTFFCALAGARFGKGLDATTMQETSDFSR